MSANGCRGAVVDLAKSNPPGWEQDVRPKLLKPTDSVLYELHVRDFSIHTDSGMKYRGKYKAFTEEGLRDSEGNALGLDHLEELGVTHVHLLPVFDFRTVNELDGYANGRLSREYNWGYDPQNYNVPEGSYATDPMDPIVRIRELKEMVLALHARESASSWTWFITIRTRWTTDRSSDWRRDTSIARMDTGTYRTVRA